MTGPRPRPDTPDRYRPQGRPATDGAVGRPDDAWLLEDDELRYAGRLDDPEPADGAEVEADGRTWAVDGDATEIGERGKVLAPEPDPSSGERLGLIRP